MKYLISLVMTVVVFSMPVLAALPNKYNLMIAPGTLTENSVVLLWDKQFAKDSVQYEILLNAKAVGFTAKTNYVLTGLKPNTSYSISLRLTYDKKTMLQELYVLKFKTAAKGKIYNILDYGAKAEDVFNNTKFIQAAINACSPGGTAHFRL